MIGCGNIKIIVRVGDGEDSSELRRGRGSVYWDSLTRDEQVKCVDALQGIAHRMSLYVKDEGEYAK